MRLEDLCQQDEAASLAADLTGQRQLSKVSEDVDSGDRNKKIIQELRYKVDQTQEEHKRELDSLKSAFDNKQEKLVEHFQGLIKRQKQETSQEIQYLAERCQ